MTLFYLYRETKKSSLISISQYTQNNPNSLFYNLQLQTTSHTTTSTTASVTSSNTLKQSYYCVEGPISGTDGYFYQQFYDLDSCDGDLTYTEGLYGDYCSSDDMGAYYKLSFSDGILDYLLDIHISIIYDIYILNQCYDTIYINI